MIGAPPRGRRWCSTARADITNGAAWSVQADLEVDNTLYGDGTFTIARSGRPRWGDADAANSGRMDIVMVR